MCQASPELLRAPPPISTTVRAALRPRNGIRSSYMQICMQFTFSAFCKRRMCAVSKYTPTACDRTHVCAQSSRARVGALPAAFLQGTRSPSTAPLVTATITARCEGTARCHAQGARPLPATVPAASGRAAPPRRGTRVRPSGHPLAQQPEPSAPRAPVRTRRAPICTTATHGSLATWEHSSQRQPDLSAGANACAEPARAGDPPKPSACTRTPTDPGKHHPQGHHIPLRCPWN